MDQYVRYFEVNTVDTFSMYSGKECEEVLKVNQGNNNFTIIHNNIRSIDKNIEEFKIFLQGMGANFDCLELTET